jgi:hypothetical protein
MMRLFFRIYLPYWIRGCRCVRGSKDSIGCIRWDGLVDVADCRFHGEEWAAERLKR